MTMMEGYGPAKIYTDDVSTLDNEVVKVRPGKHEASGLRTHEESTEMDLRAHMLCISGIGSM